MKKDFAVIIILTTLLFAFFTGCTAFAEISCPSEIMQYTNNEYMSTTNIDCKQSLNVNDASLEENVFAFSQNLFRKILASGEENVVISPLSVYYVLAMIALGALEDTLCEFNTLLGIEPHSLARKLYILTDVLEQSTGSTTVNIGGSVWISDFFKINPDFYQVISYYFRAGAYTRDLMSQLTINEINEWIYNQTQGLIADAVYEIEPEIIMILINTLYLSARWARTFNPMSERAGTFYLESGEFVEAVFLSTNHISLAVSVTDYYEAVFLPYDDDRTGFILVRPTDGTSIRDFIFAADLNDILQSLSLHSEVLVQMPKIDKTFEVTLNDYLKKMGLVLAFDQFFSNLSGLVAEDAMKPYLIYLSEVIQKARLLVHSKGTEAAAVTWGLPAYVMSPFHPIELNFNTPFVYLIYDTQTNVVLFMGVVDNPDV